MTYNTVYDIILPKYGKTPLLNKMSQSGHLQKQGGAPIMKNFTFGTLEYVRPDVDAFEEKLKGFTERIKNAKSYMGGAKMEGHLCVECRKVILDIEQF